MRRAARRADERVLPDRAGHPVHDDYHEREYGVPSRDDEVMCERLALEIFQAGLSWEIDLAPARGDP